MAKPALLALHSDRETLAALEQTLGRRFGADYQVLAAATPAAALEALDTHSRAGEQAAVLLADQGLQGMTGIQFLSRAHALHPAAKRVLLIPYGDVAAGIAGLQAMAQFLKPLVTATSGGDPGPTLGRRAASSVHWVAGGG